MSLFIASLNSGSNGNCYYIGNKDEAVLVDAGISCRETERRMKKLGLSMEKVKAIFISHEHYDHITGVPALSRKYQLPVYITPGTLQNSRIPVEEHLVISFSAASPVVFSTLTITAFKKLHDAAEPYSFMISSGKINVGVFTDIGAACENLISHFKKCHAAFLESNYDEEMLMKGNYPYHLKKRISGGNGHLSNAQALELFLTHRSEHLSHLILSHLSKNNNSPQLVQDLFDLHSGDTQVIVASRYQASGVYCIDGEKKGSAPSIKAHTQQHQTQLSLF